MAEFNETPERIKHHYDRTVQTLSQVIVGQEALIKELFICLLCGGHALIEGVPGLGKTLIVRSLSRILDLKYSRIQFTPDLMPADILGTNIVKTDENGSRRFEFYKGPVFGQLILADEINRASPKTQSALLEAMQEERVTVFGVEHVLTPPFMVLATQNPIEMQGTYPLPEAQVDRFFFKLKIGYPSRKDLHAIIEKTTRNRMPELTPILGASTILEMRRMVKNGPIASHVQDYAVRLVLATHPEDASATDTIRRFALFGASPRGVQTLVLAAKARALFQGRYNVSIEDIRAAAKPALRHRILLNIKAEAEGIHEDDIIDELLRKVPETLT